MPLQFIYQCGSCGQAIESKVKEGAKKLRRKCKKCGHFGGGGKAHTVDQETHNRLKAAAKRIEGIHIGKVNTEEGPHTDHTLKKSTDQPPSSPSKAVVTPGGGGLSDSMILEILENLHLAAASHLDPGWEKAKAWSRTSAVLALPLWKAYIAEGDIGIEELYLIGAGPGWFHLSQAKNKGKVTSPSPPVTPSPPSAEELALAAAKAEEEKILQELKDFQAEIVDLK